MLIHYKENPLNTVVELRSDEMRELWYQLMIEELRDSLCEIHMEIKSDRPDLKLISKKSEMFYYEDEPKELYDRIDWLMQKHMDALKESHLGDCICVPTSCLKCKAEELVNVHTIKGLGKHEANKIFHLFKEGFGIDKVIDHLYHHKPNPTWKASEEVIMRWKKEATRAADWLVDYRDNYYGRIA